LPARRVRVCRGLRRDGCLKVTSLSPVADVLLPGSVALPWPAWFVDAGNPHLVLLAPSLHAVAIAEVGRC